MKTQIENIITKWKEQWRVLQNGQDESADGIQICITDLEKEFGLPLTFENWFSLYTDIPQLGHKLRLRAGIHHVQDHDGLHSKLEHQQLLDQGWREWQYRE